MVILAIDPGPEKSSAVIYDSERGLVAALGEGTNSQILDVIQTHARRAPIVAIEMMQSSGLKAGSDQFETCRWVGRFEERAAQDGAGVVLLARNKVKLAITGSGRAKDGEIRQALIDRFGPGKDRAIGTKKAPGPLYGVKCHQWQALAVAVALAEGCETYDYLRTARGGARPAA